MIVGGSYSLKLRGLLDRKLKDIDLIGAEYNEKLCIFCKSLGIKVDFVNRGDLRFEWFKHKNRYIKIAPLHVVLFYKFKLQMKINADPHCRGVKHYNDLIHIFSVLGKEKSINEIDKMSLNKEERDVLLEWVELSNNINNHVK